MITLHVYLSPMAGKERELEAAVRDQWLAAMSEQPGFLRAAVLKPFAGDDLARLEAVTPASAIEVVAFWRSERDRLAWVARPLHDQVFSTVLELASSVSYTLQTVTHGWNV